VFRANVHFISQNLIASDWFPSENNKQIKKRRQRVSSLLPTTTIGTSINRNSNTSMGSNLSTKSFQWNEISTSSIAFSRNFFLSPSFASGLAYSTSLCDSLMINQYFNSMLKSILREFIFASWKDADYLTIPSTPPGTIKEENHFSPTSSIGSSIISPHGIQRSSLFAVELPLDFVGKTFAYVYHYLLSSDAILTLGVYRCRPIEQQTTARIEQQEKERHVPFGFVYVNPLPTDLLTGNDLLYVLSHKQPCWA
jgi:potassium large conductance calcium-activated channel subfamily M alpha protein 1